MSLQNLQYLLTSHYQEVGFKVLRVSSITEKDIFVLNVEEKKDENLTIKAVWHFLRE